VDALFEEQAKVCDFRPAIAAGFSPASPATPFAGAPPPWQLGFDLNTQSEIKRLYYLRRTRTEFLLCG
jgi:hypothetical protein